MRHGQDAGGCGQNLETSGCTPEMLARTWLVATNLFRCTMMPFVAELSDRYLTFQLTVDIVIQASL